MPRHARKNYNTSFFHVIIQGINKEFIFNEEEYIIYYLKIIEKKLEMNEVKILAYCIMNNHAHFLIHCKNIEQLSNFMLKVNTSFAKYYNKKKERVGFVFRDRYISEPIMDERYLVKCINYIHNNPVKANIVRKCADYKYSSYSKFLKSEMMEDFFEITNIKFETKLFMDAKVEEGFLDVDINREVMILNYINEFRRKRRIELFRIYEDREILKELIYFLKNQHLVKYTEIMEMMGISKGTMEQLKKR